MYDRASLESMWAAIIPRWVEVGTNNGNRPRIDSRPLAWTSKVAPVLDHEEMPCSSCLDLLALSRSLSLSLSLSRSRSLSPNISLSRSLSLSLSLAQYLSRSLARSWWRLADRVVRGERMLAGNRFIPRTTYLRGDCPVPKAWSEVSQFVVGVTGKSKHRLPHAFLPQRTCIMVFSQKVKVSRGPTTECDGPDSIARTNGRDEWLPAT